MESPVLLILTAGGVGKRFGKPHPKQLETIDGQSVLFRTATFFVSVKPDLTVVTAPEGFEERFRDELSGLSYPIEVITGGKERSDSVRRAIQVLVEKGFDGDSVVLVHDGVRPFLNEKTVDEVIWGVRTHGAAIPYVPVSGTARRLKEDGFGETLERKDLAIVTTPQGATLRILSHCMSRQQFSFPDESTLMSAEGVPMLPVLDWPLNIKLTEPEDLKAARVLWGL